jgi:twitching motility protein PilT
MELDTLLEAAVEVGASDVHLKLGRPPLVRRDADLAPLEGMPILQPRDLGGVLQQVCEGSPQRLSSFLESGELDIPYTTSSQHRFRVNGFRQRGETSFALRLIPRVVPTIEQLGLPPGVARLADEPHGLVLVTGPTGSGKSTTLASMVNRLNTMRRSHIVTVEDPIEFLHEDESCVINQREVGIDTESFRRGLRQALRQDPDVILIGELRDEESAETALQAAESGHLVLTTLHTIDTAESIGRIIELFPSGKQQQVRSILAGVLRGVVSQRLLPRVDGGRVAAVEVMVSTARITEFIRDSRTELIPEAIEDGKFFDMQTLRQSLVDLVVAGVVDRETAANVAVNRHDFVIAVEHALKAENVVPEDNDFAVQGLRLRTLGSDG